MSVKGRSMTTYSDTVSSAMEKDYTVFTCCSAGCNFDRFNWSDPEFLRWLSKRLSEIRDSLLIDKKNTTTFKNSKRSPLDKRTSSVITGSFGAVIIFILVTAITIPDLLMLMTFLKDNLRATKEITSDMQTQKGSNVP
ncbi:hypothetical protein FSP39_002687 [Pinctada imbricata]|uniref:Uncharacterized protein n=1 Tax=Pinctada imbricata TaxID=66713 RepID=A0AA89CBF1_PINIB|nr:hypothetical protein FSP39_002687 [Pinctada imbricata]